MFDILPDGFAPLRGLIGLLAGAAAGVVFTVYAELVRMGDKPAAILMNGEPLIYLGTIAAVGWWVMIISPAWYWVGRPIYYQVRR